MKKIKIVAVFMAMLVALSVVICACGNNKKGNENETTVSENVNENTTDKGGEGENTTDKGGEGEYTVETGLGGYVESEVVTFVEVTIEED